MTRLKSFSLAGALALAMAASSAGAAFAIAGSGGSGGGGAGDGGLMLNTVPPMLQLTLPPSPQPLPDQATSSRECSFELLRGHICEPRRAR